MSCTYEALRNAMTEQHKRENMSLLFFSTFVDRTYNNEVVVLAVNNWIPKRLTPNVRREMGKSGDVANVATFIIYYTGLWRVMWLKRWSTRTLSMPLNSIAPEW